MTRIRHMAKALAAAMIAVGVLMLGGCKTRGFWASKSVIEGQTPGVAAGAGATLTGPANSAAPSTQTAQRRTAYYPPPAADRVESGKLKVEGQKTPPPPEAVVGGSTDSQLSALSSQLPPVAVPAPAWIDEKVTTQIGQHQDAAAIVKLAAAASGWPMLRWIGLGCVLAGVGGLLWSHGNPDGYPLVFWKVGGAGVFFMLAGENPAWLLLLILPLGFYAVQKLNLLRIP
jgi:hypothetical protein